MKLDAAFFASLGELPKVGHEPRHRLSIRDKQYIVESLRMTAKAWPDEIMRDRLRGAKTFAVTLLIDAEMTMTEAEQMVEAALAVEAREEAGR